MPVFRLPGRQSLCARREVKRLAEKFPAPGNLRDSGYAEREFRPVRDSGRPAREHLLTSQDTPSGRVFTAQSGRRPCLISETSALNFNLYKHPFSAGFRYAFLLNLRSSFRRFIRGGVAGGSGGGLGSAGVPAVTAGRSAGLRGMPHRTLRHRARALAVSPWLPGSAGRCRVSGSRPCSQDRDQPLPPGAWSAASGRYAAPVLAGEQRVRAASAVPYPACPLPGMKISQAVAARADDRWDGEIPHGYGTQGPAAARGLGAGHRPSPSAGPPGRGGPTSIRRPKARSSRSAEDRPAKASKKPRQIAGPKSGWSPYVKV